MGVGRLASVDEQFRLTLSPRNHPVEWLKGRHPVPCVVEIHAPGRVAVWPLDAWSREHGLSLEEATELLTAAEGDPDVEEPAGASVFLCQIGVKESKSKNATGAPLRQLTLPDMAILALFEQGWGPMAVVPGQGRRGRSGKVLFVSFAYHFELWGLAHL